MGKEGLHDGHRDRVKKEFLQKGFDMNTPPHKIMEVLLFYSIPRKDTNEMAHELLNRFGSISGILDAPAEEIVKIPGISTNTAAFFELIVLLTRIYHTEKNSKGKRYMRVDDVCDYLMNQYIGYQKEVFSVISFSGSGKMLGFDILASGNVNEVSVSTRKVIETVINRNAVCAIIAHNHPNGTALPSKEDIAVTMDIKNALEHINVKLIDHIIIAGDDYVSMCQSQGYRDIFA